MRLRRDERGVSEVIGALFVFTILVASFMSYQVVLVPQQNTEVEFEHYQGVQRDVQQMRADVINAGNTGDEVNGTSTRSSTVQLGTTYPSRLLGLNAAPPSGTWQTVQTADGRIRSPGSPAVNFTNICGIDDGDETTIRANHVVYQPIYHYFSEDSPHRYENTVYYQDIDSSTLLNRTGETFVHPNGRNGETVTIYPIQGNFSKNGISAATVDFEGGDIGEATTSDFTMTVPTRITADQWRDLTGDPANVTITDNATVDNRVDFEFSNEWTVRCHPIGIGEAPEQVDTPGLSNVGGSSGDGDGSVSTVNPSGDDDLVLTGSDENDTQNFTDLSFTNEGSKKTVTEIRVPFYFADQEDKQATEIEAFAGVETFDGAETLDVGDQLTVLDSNVEFDPGDSEETIQFGSDDVKTRGDFFILVLKFESGGTATYFVSPKDD